MIKKEKQGIRKQLFSFSLVTSCVITLNKNPKVARPPFGFTSL